MMSLTDFNAVRVLLLTGVVFAAAIAATSVQATEVVIRGARELTAPAGDNADSAVETSGTSQASAGQIADAAEIEEKVRVFLDRFIDANKTPAEQVALFADDVEYYDQGIVGKRAIERDVERYVRHWPQRTYRLLDVPYIAVDPQTDRIFVSYTISYEVANAARQARGTADYGAVISNLDDAPKVEWIRERIARRKRPVADDE